MVYFGVCRRLRLGIGLRLPARCLAVRFGRGHMGWRRYMALASKDNDECLDVGRFPGASYWWRAPVLGALVGGRQASVQRSGFSPLKG
jgi:hypothetical protein